MCLTKVDKMPTSPPKVGYKIFRLKDKRYYSSTKGNGRSIPLGKWVHEKNYRVSSISPGLLDTFPFTGITYKTGWHVFATKRAAVSLVSRSEGEVVRKVLIKNIVALGKQTYWLPFSDRHFKVIVSEYILIEENKK